MVFLMYYSIFMVIPYIVDLEKEMTQHRHLKELGYDYTYQLNIVERFLKEFKRYALCFIPIVNIWNLIEFLDDDKYPRFGKKDIKKMLDRGEIAPLKQISEREILRVVSARPNNLKFGVASLSKEALAEQVYVVKTMKQSDDQNLIENWRDLTVDTKIQLLLGELEALYYEKAQEMGIDLDKEVSLCEARYTSEQEEKKLKK